MGQRKAVTSPGGVIGLALARHLGGNERVLEHAHTTSWDNTRKKGNGRIERTIYSQYLL